MNNKSWAGGVWIQYADMMTDSMMKNMKIYLIQIENSYNRYNLLERKRKPSLEGEYRAQTESTTEWLNLGKEVLQDGKKEKWLLILKKDRSWNLSLFFWSLILKAIGDLEYLNR